MVKGTSEYPQRGLLDRDLSVTGIIRFESDIEQEGRATLNLTQLRCKATSVDIQFLFRTCGVTQVRERSPRGPIIGHNKRPTQMPLTKYSNAQAASSDRCSATIDRVITIKALVLFHAIDDGRPAKDETCIQNTLTGVQCLV